MGASFLKRLTAAGSALPAAGLLCLYLACGQWEAAQTGLAEGFEDASSLPSNWVRTSSRDFAEATVDVVGVPGDTRLRLRASTLGTEPKSVKSLGVRSNRFFDLTEPILITLDLDWNEQSNGSYLSGGLILSPHLTSSSATDESDWFRIAYVGVPPGKNARLEASGRFSGSKQTLFTEGWPAQNRLGRRIGLQKLELRLNALGVELRENGKVVYRSEQPLIFEEFYLYLFLSSHSNYGPREIYFDNVRVESVAN